MRSMKHSIKREQSHARMSFAECENVRATLKHMKLSFHLILTLTAMLTMAQTAWAVTVEETVTWPMSTGCSVTGSTLSNTAGNRMVLNNNMIWQQTSDRTGIDTHQSKLVTSTYNTEISFPDIEGTVTKVELKNFSFGISGLNLYAGKSMSSLLDKSTGGTAYPSDDSGTYSGDVTYTGSMDVTTSSPLKLMFRAVSSMIPDPQIFQFAPNDAWHTAGYISVTYQKEVPADPQHTFSTPSVNGNTLTVTCTNNGAGHECSLTNRQATLTLTANDGSVSGFQFDAPSLNLMEFNNQTGLGATAGTITYTYKSTGETINSAMFVYKSGAYTASVTVTVGGNNYTLTKDFELYDATFNNSYAQFSISPTALRDGDVVTITFTPQLGESVEMLTLTGNNTTLTLGNGITDHHDGTYTFTMPRDILTLSATFNFPLNENDITKNESGDTYTIKTAEGWDYFCRRILFDKSIDGFKGKTIELTNDITVTATMAGNYEHRFKGTFDGKGYTLTFNPTSVGQYTAPFYCTDGATIRNLHATGCIQAGDFQNCGGMVGLTNGNLTIENCRVSTQISSTYSGNAGHGGFVGFLSSQYNQCHITGCVFDGLIYNPNTWNQTYGCGGFIGAMSQYGYAILEDCLFIEGQYDNNGNKCELLWGNDNNNNSTFFHRSNGYGGGTLTNCFYVGTRGLKQGSPAVESATAPANFAHFGDPTTDYGFLKVYGHTMVFNNKYYTPTYGDLVETYSYSGVKSYNIEYDDKPLGIPDITSPLWTESLRYNRSFTNGKPVTIMLPFNFTRNRITLAGSNENPSGKFYEFKGIEENLEHKWVAVMIEAGETLSNEVVENTLQANHPYLYVPGESTEHWAMYVSGGFSIFTEGNEGGEKQTEYDGTADFAWNKWNFIGTYQPRYWSDSENSEEIGKVYGFAGAAKEVDEQLVVAGDFVRAKVGAKIRPTSCYLKWTGYESDDSDTNAAKASGMSGAASVMNELPQTITVKLIDANGETTGIGEIDTTTGDITFDGWWTLDGVRLDGKPAKSGMYINNGKKVVVE